MAVNKLKVSFSAQLSPLDSETQTYGCRQTDPNICRWNSLEGICAFTREDGICLKPSNSWKKQYKKLKSLSEGK